MALSIVYTPRDVATPPAIDIVAVHGLGGDSTNTWTHPKSKAVWLKDFLPLQIPDARIMTFGYNADAAFGQSTAEVVDHAKSLLASLVDKREEPEETKRPLIFIAHSLGGIVVKQALFQARLEWRYQAIQDATLGLMFLGTPHRGSDKATYGKVLANVARFVTHRPPARLLDILQKNSDFLLRLTTDFRFQLPDYQVYSFFEQRPIKGLSSLIVEKHSALLDVNHEEQIPVDADHSAMCKFETAEDDTFEKVYKRIRRIRKDSGLRANSKDDIAKHQGPVPSSSAKIFTSVNQPLPSLLIAAASPSVSALEHVLRTTSDINTTENGLLGRNGLHVAAISNQPKNVSLLLRNGANVHAIAEGGITPITLACMVGHAEIVRILIEEGNANPNVRDWSQGTPLHAAAINGHLEVTRVLLEHGADPWLSETTGWTPLSAATIKRHEEVVQMLAQAMEAKRDIVKNDAARASTIGR